MTTSARSQRPVKREVLEELKEPMLLLPSLVNGGLAGNDRAKYYLTLLQSARAQADTATVRPGDAGSSLREERLAAGVGDTHLDEVVAGATRLGDGRYAIPHAERIHRELLAAVREMLLPLATAGTVEGPDENRLDALAATAPDLGGDVVPGDYIDWITSTRAEERDSLHLLVMDAHRALNRLQAQIATATLDGAVVYGLADDDIPQVQAFMAGVNRTAPLKFDHPGLGTTATRVGDRLLIQNDLGTTEAHVVVIAVEGHAVTMTYTDVHLRRLRFFESLFEGYAVTWSDTRGRWGGPVLGDHHVTTGTFEAPDRPTLVAYLTHAASRLVFVLDWNRARKRLQGFLDRDDAIEVLSWAAEHEVGHMAFLALGGERLIYDAVNLTAKTPARYGEPLVALLGRDGTLEVTRFALQVAAEGMLAGKSQLLIRDELRVEMARRVQASHRRLLDAHAEHASLIVECARALQGAVGELADATRSGFLERVAERAATWEHRADEILVTERQAAHRLEGGETVVGLIGTADNAIDDLEEAVFLLTLVPPNGVAVIREVLEELAQLTTMAAREHLKAVEIARLVLDGSAPEDLEDFLVAVARVAALEHEADRADRTARAALVRSAPDFRSLHVGDRISQAVEGATDELLRSALRLRDHLLGLLAGR